MNESFPTLIGKFIHHCGGLELLTNKSIRFYAKDSLLSVEVIKSSWSHRISLLRKLLYERSDICKKNIDSLCNELEGIRNNRNLIAHNPIFSTKPNGTGTEEILIIRYKMDKVDSEAKITKEDLVKLVEQTSKLLKRFSSMVPGSTD